jgi:N-acetylgalactosamine kinase
MGSFDMQTKKPSRKIVSVILAAGRGTRMESPDLHKVCFPLEGRPVITRAIETYQRCGIQSHFLVVGSMAEQVMEAASAAPGTHFFCYQTEQRGTGNAAKTAANLLAAMDYKDDVLVVAGDKVIEDSVLVELIDRFHKSECDLAFVVGGVDDFPSSGRVVYGGDSQPLGIVEVFDIAKMHLLLAIRRIVHERPLPAEEAESLALSYLKQERKAALALGSLWDAIKAGASLTKDMIEANFEESDFSIRINDSSLSPDLLANVKHVNLSVYLFRAPAMYEALDLLSSDNAQQEEYLTDTIGILASGGHPMQTFPVAYPEQVMAFNTPEELRAIEQHLAGKRGIVVKEPPRTIRSAREWLQSFSAADPGSIRYLSSIYGPGHANVEVKRRRLVSMLKGYIKHFGDDEVLITRAPGRVNIMGRHVDHQGGHGNMIAIDRDVYQIVGARDDRQVHLRSLEPHQFPDRVFSIDDLLTGYEGGDWLDFVNTEFVREQVTAAHGDWSQYAKAPIARLQAKYSHRRFKGMSILAAGNVPIAAGLSSSSAVVVATAEAVIALNEIEVSPEQFVELCGEGEWYVGTRGGAGDHAAMKLAQRGQVVQVGFFPFGMTDAVEFPANHIFMVCNSHEKAHKTAGARDVFNHRVACYNMGRELLKQGFPRYAPAIAHLRDFNVRNLGVGCDELLTMLATLPVTMTRKDILDRIPSDLAHRYLSTHSESHDTYPIRCVVIYGLAECERSRTCADLLRRGGVSEFGKWMNVSHDGDRVVRWDKHGGSWPFEAVYSDDVMAELIADARSGSAETALALQPGAYSCSIPQIDRMVDIALSVEGVLGAQILGAGLGGCILALAHKNAHERLEQAMTKQFYEPADLEPDMFACYPIAGSGVASL